MPSSLPQQTLRYLRHALNEPAAQFRKGQLEAIEALVNARAATGGATHRLGEERCLFPGDALAAGPG
jgi:hypothetical protein